MASKLPQLNTTLKPEWRTMLDQIEAETGFNDQAVIKAMLHALHRRWNTIRDWPSCLPAGFNWTQAAEGPQAIYDPLRAQEEARKAANLPPSRAPRAKKP